MPVRVRYSGGDDGPGGTEAVRRAEGARSLTSPRSLPPRLQPRRGGQYTRVLGDGRSASSLPVHELNALRGSGRYWSGGRRAKLDVAA